MNRCLRNPAVELLRGIFFAGLLVLFHSLSIGQTITRLPDIQEPQFEPAQSNTSGKGLPRASASLPSPFEPLTGWTLRHREPPLAAVEAPMEIGIGYWSMAFGNGLFVAVGDKGAILVSSDGHKWTPHNAGTEFFLNTIAFGNGQFVAAASSSILISTNGLDWKVQAAPGKAISRIQFINGAFFAFSQSTMLRSEDAVSWSSILENEGLAAITYGNGKYVAVGTQSSRGISLVSTDLMHWTTQSIGEGLVLRGIAFANERFVAAAYAFGNSQFAPGGFGGVLLSSSDGVDWDIIPDGGVGNNLEGISYEGGIFLTFGGIRTGASPANVIMTSRDGIRWTRHFNTSDLPTVAVAYGNGLFVSLSSTTYFATRSMFTISADGADWHGTADSINLRAIAFGQKTFVAVGSHGTIFASTNAVDWIKCDSPAGVELLDVCYSQGTFVAVGQLGTILSSTNGFAWERRGVQGVLDLSGVTYGNGVFVTVAGKETLFSPIFDGLDIRTSPDGILWTSKWSSAGPGSIPVGLVGVAYGDDNFLAVGFSPGSHIVESTMVSFGPL